MFTMTYKYRLINLYRVIEHCRALSEVPNSKVISAVRIGLIDDKFIVNPTTKEMEGSDLDLLIAGSDSAILMIEVNP